MGKKQYIDYEIKNYFHILEVIKYFISKKGFTYLNVCIIIYW